MKRILTISSICIWVRHLTGLWNVNTMQNEFGGICLLPQSSCAFYWLAVVLCDPLSVATWHVQLGNSDFGIIFFY